MADPVDQVIAYHIQTKHHFNRYARSLGFLDWANQPDPFRRFDGAPLVPLPLLKPDDEPLSPPYDAIFQPGAVLPQAVTLRALSRFFELALGLSAWKKAGESEWALRCNPSSGNLHPTEGYIVVAPGEGCGLEPGLYHYAPKEHALERRARFPAEQLVGLLARFPPDALLFGLTSIHWREAWKYGERAFRYCHHDVGHAIGSARLAAATLGWDMALLEGLEQNTIALLLGTSRLDDFSGVEAERPDCLAVIWPHTPASDQTIDMPLFLDAHVVKSLVPSAWHGQANPLSREHAVRWEAIDRAAAASWKVSSERTVISLATNATSDPMPVMQGGAITAGQIIRQRRSAVSFDGRTSIAAASFYRMLERVMPRAESTLLKRPVPWDVWPYDPAIHLMLFVHRIEGLQPGLYFLIRDPRKVSFIQHAMNPELSWTNPPECPDHLPLYWLLEGDARKLAVQVSCHQDIAGDSAFSLGMLAEFESRLRGHGAWYYPRLFWEAGLLGQVLYLEAEAAGVRATGIGCFFDDPVHEILALNGLHLQSLYHFTIGGPVDDGRLMTMPPYHHLK